MKTFLKLLYPFFFTGLFGYGAVDSLVTAITLSMKGGSKVAIALNVLCVVANAYLSVAEAHAFIKKRNELLGR